MYLLLYSIERETGRQKQIERRKNSHPMFFRVLFLLWRVLLLCEMELEINEMTPLSAQINVHQCPPMGLGRIQLKNYESQQKNICCVVVTWHELGIWLEHNTTDVWRNRSRSIGQGKAIWYCKSKWNINVCPCAVTPWMHIELLTSDGHNNIKVGVLR